MKFISYVVLSVLVGIVSNAAIAANCSGNDSKTKAYVFGWCLNGELTIINTESKVWSYGYCTEGRPFAIADSQTESVITGECHSEKP